MPQVYVAAGSNIEPERHLAMAVRELERQFRGHALLALVSQPRRSGSRGRTSSTSSPALRPSCRCTRCCSGCMRIETLCGRPREAPRWAPRSMDLDVLLYGDLVCQEPHLKLPRPDLLKRAYMLGPLADLAPDLVHPTERRTIGELWQRFRSRGAPLGAGACQRRSLNHPTSRCSCRHPPRGSDP